MAFRKEDLKIKNFAYMKTTKLIFLRHADTKKDQSINASQWGLSEKGRLQAEEVTKLSLMDSVDVIYASEEQKTSLTVELLSKRLGIDIRSLSFFNEVKRDDEFLTKEEFEIEKIKQLTDLSYSAFNGESGNEALTRFKEGVELITKWNEGKTILVVTHGTILNIYFSNLLNTYNQLIERWNKTAFCAIGIVENKKVIKDIIDES